MGENSTPLSKTPHPTAKAFFDALDSKRQSSKQSTALQERAQSLGWRNRYSQNDHYPISMLIEEGGAERDAKYTVQQVQRGEVEGTYGTGATVWPAAMVLLKYLERHPDLVRRRRVVDLGSGTGVTSLAVALLGASHVVCTDGEDPVVGLALKNCQTAVPVLARLFESNEEGHIDNKLMKLGGCTIRVEKFWWGTHPLPDDECEVILVADCVLPKLYPIAPLVAAIDDLLRTPGTKASTPVAILSYEYRYYPDYDPRTRFQELAEARGLKLEIIPRERQDPVYSVDDIEIWHVSVLVE